MPLAITGLNEREYATLRQWIKEGAVIDEQPVAAGGGRQRIRQWEDTNHPIENRLVPRYLYEHYFLAHFYFEG
jgi:hypothetical protein